MTTIIGTTEGRHFYLRGTLASGLVQLIKEYVGETVHNEMWIEDMGIYIHEVRE